MRSQAVLVKQVLLFSISGSVSLQGNLSLEGQFGPYEMIVLAWGGDNFIMGRSAFKTHYFWQAWRLVGTRGLEQDIMKTDLMVC
jgi:hypothetical protein